jgi:hypothetical protein
MEDLSHLPRPLLLLFEVVNHPLLFSQHLFGFKGATDGFCFLHTGNIPFLLHASFYFLDARRSVVSSDFMCFP